MENRRNGYKLKDAMGEMQISMLRDRESESMLILYNVSEIDRKSWQCIHVE